MHAIAWTRSIRASDLQDNIKSGLLSGRAKETLRHTEVVLVLRTLFLRNREVRPLWWDVAAEASSRFPSNQALALFAAVGSHLGLRISNFARKKPSNVRISLVDILSFDGLASSLELQAGLSRIGVRTLFAPLGSSHPEQR